MAAPVPSAPAATRPRRPGWRDKRIWIGALILAGSILAGTKLMSGADQSVGVWAANADLAAGAPVTSQDVVRVQARFGDAALAGRYLSADAPVPDGLTLTRAIGRGEMLPRQALASTPDSVVRVPLVVEIGLAPADLARGDLVDVWVADKADAAEPAEAARIFDDVVVLLVPPADAAATGAGTTQVIVGLDQAAAGDLGKALGRISAGRVILTGQE